MERRAGKTVSVSWSPAQDQYRKYIGYQLGRNGKPQPKCWYLGEDEREAVRRAVELVAEWNRLKAAGATVWPLKAASGDASENKRSKDDFVDAKPPMHKIERGLREAQKKVGSLRRGPNNDLPHNGPTWRSEDGLRGYRLEPPHHGKGWHIDWYDWSGGKRGAGGLSGTIPID
ncbi:MAG: hypothetical protein IT438_03935 [Phycisphaerales bacterium]|nr:hypothetical protein [Phycisphaerales bacterium]